MNAFYLFTQLYAAPQFFLKKSLFVCLISGSKSNDIINTVFFLHATVTIIVVCTLRPLLSLWPMI